MTDKPRHRKPGKPTMGAFASNGFGWGQHVDKTRRADGPAPKRLRARFSAGSRDESELMEQGEL